MTLVYDRECPVCSNYTHMVQIREAIGELVLVNAREDSDALRELSAAGFDLDEGMALIIDDQVHYGADAIHMLALMGTHSGMFNRLNNWVFRSQARTRILYPVLKAGRNLLLKILGREKINNLNIDGNKKF